MSALSDLLSNFYKLSGCVVGDVLATNTTTWKVVTTKGGKYALSGGTPPNATIITRECGPKTPKDTPKAVQPFGVPTVA